MLFYGPLQYQLLHQAHDKFLCINYKIWMNTLQLMRPVMSFFCQCICSRTSELLYVLLKNSPVLHCTFDLLSVCLNYPLSSQSPKYLLKVRILHIHLHIFWCNFHYFIFYNSLSQWTKIYLNYLKTIILRLCILSFLSTLIMLMKVFLSWLYHWRKRNGQLGSCVPW